MKKVFFSILGMVFYGATFAQFSQGNFLVGGMTNLSTTFETNKVKSGGTTTTVSKTTSFSLQPQGGYFVIDNLAAGAGIGLSTSTTKFDGTNNKDGSNQLVFAPFGRYYFDKLYVQGAFQFGSAKSKATSGGTTTTTKFSVGGWSILGGYAFFISDAISLEPQVGYASQSLKVKNTNAKSIDSGIVIGIGLYGYISK